MHKLLVTFRCGHTLDSVVRGVTQLDRVMYADDIAHGLCRDCKTVKTAKASADLLPLVGSEKQVNWAVTIRAAKVKQARQFIKSYESRVEPELFAEMQEDVERLARQTSAAWWIAHRTFYNVGDLLDLVKA